VVTLVHLSSVLTYTGLLNEDDNGRTDLGTLEKRLAEKDMSRRASAIPGGSHPTSPSQATQSTPQQDANSSSPQSSLTSPEPQSEKDVEKRDEPQKTPEEVEALSDMMCSLVTNNCGETRYIGKQSKISSICRYLTCHRFFLWIFYLLAEGHTVGKREDRRLFLPGNDL
jgi:hypothetical protein